MASVSTVICETGESIVPDSTTTNLERAEEFNRGQDILYKAKDGKYYLGTVAELDAAHERCLVKFADGTDSWALFKQLERLSAPTPPPIPCPTPPPIQRSTTVLDSTNSTSVSVGLNDVDMTFRRMCVVCKRSAPERLKEIAQCTRCGRGYHAVCHVPTIEGSVMKDEKAYKWLCRRCYEFDSIVEKNGENVVATKIRIPDKKADSTGIGIPKETLDTLRDFKLPYNLESLSWDPSHRYNIEQRYCYCGLNGDWTRCMLQCGRCRQWFHAQCIVCLRRPLYAGDQFYIFICAICHRKDKKFVDDNSDLNIDRKGERIVVPKVLDEYGEEVEFIRRLEMKWVDLIHLMLFNLTTFNATKYFDLDGVLIPYIRDNWYGLQLPLKIVNCTASERRNTIIAVLTTNRNRFKLKINKSTTNNSNTWGLRVRLPPPVSAYNLPSNQRINEVFLKQHWRDNKRIEILGNPSMGSEFTMGGLLVTRATIHCEKVGGIIRGVAYQDYADSEIEDLSQSAHNLSYQNEARSNASQILRQRTNSIQYAPGSVKKSASTVAPGNKKPIGAIISLGKDRNKATIMKDYAMDTGIVGLEKLEEWNKPVRDTDSVNNNETQTTTEDGTGLFMSRTSGIYNKKRLLMKRNETRKLLRRKCRMEQEKNMTDKRRTRLSLDAATNKSSLASDSSYPSPNNLPPTPPTSISDPPTPPATGQSSTTDYTSDNTVSYNPSKPRETSSNNKLTRANLSDRDKFDSNRDTSLDNRVNTPCDTSGDETSSKSTLDLIIPPPKDFEGRNNPFSLSNGEKGFQQNQIEVKKKNLNKVIGKNKGYQKQGVVKTLKRQLSAKDIRIGPNGEVKRRRIRRSLPVQQPNQSNANLAAGNTDDNTEDSTWMPSVGSCMEYVLNGRRLRVRQERQHQQTGNIVGQQEDIMGLNNKKPLMVIGGIMLDGGGSAKESPVKGTESDMYSMDDLKTTVSLYFGAATRIAAGESYNIRARRIGPNGNIQYLIEWDGSATTNTQLQQNNPLYSTPPHNKYSNVDTLASSSLNTQYYSSRTPNQGCQSVHNPYYNRTVSTSKITSGTTISGGSCKGSSSTGKLLNSSKGKLSLGSLKGGASMNVARVLTLDSLRAFNSDL